jgi:hypothetical protein
MTSNQRFRVEPHAASEFLRRLKLRQTEERLAAMQLLLEYPGLSLATSVIRLREQGANVHRRTLQRLLNLFRSPLGCLARWQTVGAWWVCWGCGQAIASADPSATSVLFAQALLPLDLGGYCRDCLTALIAEAANSAPGLRQSRSTSTFANRRATVVPVDQLYQNPSLMREFFGSDRHSSRRDYAIANLVENPRAGPLALQQLLEVEEPTALSLRSIKQISSRLRSPKAQILFSCLGTVGWTCLACSQWGVIPQADQLWQSAPDRFAPTDVRALCSSCHDEARQLS